MDTLRRRDLWACRCGRVPKLLMVPHGLDYVVECMPCGLETDLHLKMSDAVQDWNEHFGDPGKKLNPVEDDD